MLSTNWNYVCVSVLLATKDIETKRSWAVAHKPLDICACRCCAVKFCPLVNDQFIGWILWLANIHQRTALDSTLAWFSDFYLPVSHLTSSLKGIPSSYQVHLSYNLVKVAWWSTQVIWEQYINVTDAKQQTCQTHRQTAMSP